MPTSRFTAEEIVRLRGAYEVACSVCAAFGEEIQDLKQENYSLNHHLGLRKQIIDILIKQGGQEWEEKVERATLQAENATLKEQVRHLEHAGAQEGYDVEQALGKALHYPLLYPHVSKVDDGTVCVGEHVPATIAQEAANKIVAMEQRLTQAQAELAALRKGKR